MTRIGDWFRRRRLGLLTPAWVQDMCGAAHSAGLTSGFYDVPADEMRAPREAEVRAVVDEVHGSLTKDLAIKRRRFDDLTNELHADPEPYRRARELWERAVAAFRTHQEDAALVTRRLAAVTALGGVCVGLLANFTPMEWLLLAAGVGLLVFAVPALLTGAQFLFYAAGAALAGAATAIVRTRASIARAIVGWQIRRGELREARNATLLERYVLLVRAEFAAGFRMGAEARMLMNAERKPS